MIRGPRRRVVASAAVAVVLAIPFGACSDDASDDPEPLAIDRIAPAIAAVETERGGPQEYFEINATPLLVNVFVASGGEVVPYVYVDEQLTMREAEPATGETFTADAVTFDARTMLDAVVDELPDVTLEVFTIVGRGDGEVQYGVLASSAAGGRLDITLTADGRVAGVDPG